MRQQYQYGYFRHKCPIITEMDVVDRDIAGSGFFPQLKRRWHDLFLLSYTHPMSRGFYTSSQSMRMERYRQYRFHRSQIHPMSKFRYYWDCFIRCAYVITRLVFPLNSSIFYDNMTPSLFYLAAFLECWIIVDIYVNLKTGYINEVTGKVILNSNRCYINFCSKRFFLYVASAVPFHCLMLLKYGTNITCALCKCNRFVCILRLMYTVDMYRVFDLFEYGLSTGQTNKVSANSFLKIGIIAIVIMNHLQSLGATVWMLTIFERETLEEESNLTHMVRWKYSNRGKGLSNFELVCIALSRIVRSLYIFSFGYKRIQDHLDMMRSLVVYVTANLFYIWLCIEAFRLITWVTYTKDQHMTVRNNAINILECRKLPDYLRHKVDQYFKYNTSKLKIVEKYNYMYKCVPWSLRKEVIIQCYMKCILRIPYFRDWPRPFLEDLVCMMERDVFLPNDYVAEAGVQGNGLVIVDKGLLAVFSKSKVETGHLIDGDYFGMISLVTDQEIRMSYVVAITPCTLLFLNKLAFRSYMRTHPRLFLHLKNKVKEEYEEFNMNGVGT